MKNIRRKRANVFANRMGRQRATNQPPTKRLVSCWRRTVSICKFLIRSLQTIAFLIIRYETIHRIAEKACELLRDLPTNLPC